MSAPRGRSLPAADWPQWRGPELRGTSPETGLPVKWSASEGLAWKLALPSGQRLDADRERRPHLPERGRGRHASRCGASTARPAPPSGSGRSALPPGTPTASTTCRRPSPVTDGKRVFAMTGQGALKGFDLAGQELWARDLQKEYGPFGTNWGYGSSPLLFEGVLYVQVLHGMKTDEPSYLLGRRGGHRQEPLPRGAADEGPHRVARRLHHADAGAARREGRDRGRRAATS